MTPAQFKKLLFELEHLTDTQVRRVEPFLKGDDTVQPIINRDGKAGRMQRYRCKYCSAEGGVLTLINGALVSLRL
jgi:hypothetical protein